MKVKLKKKKKLNNILVLNSIERKIENKSEKIDLNYNKLEKNHINPAKKKIKNLLDQRINIMLNIRKAKDYHFVNYGDFFALSCDLFNELTQDNLLNRRDILADSFSLNNFFFLRNLINKLFLQINLDKDEFQFDFETLKKLSHDGNLQNFIKDQEKLIDHYKKHEEYFKCLKNNTLPPQKIYDFLTNVENHALKWHRYISYMELKEINTDCQQTTILHYLALWKKNPQRDDYTATQVLKNLNKGLLDEDNEVNSSNSLLSYLNTQNIQGKTALHLACETGNKVFVEELLSVPKIDLDKKDKDGKTALDLATKKGYFEISNVLEQYKAENKSNDKAENVINNDTVKAKNYASILFFPAKQKFKNANQKPALDNSKSFVINQDENAVNEDNQDFAGTINNLKPSNFNLNSGD